MNKTKILFNIICGLLVIFSVLTFSLTVPWVSARWELYFDSTIDMGAAEASIFGFLGYALVGTFIMICSLISAILSIFVLILTNINIIKIIADESISTIKENRRAKQQERLAARAAKAEEDKQKRIEELQAELDGLKNNDTNSNS